MFERVSIPSCLEKHHNITVATAESFLSTEFIALIQKEMTTFQEIFPVSKPKGSSEFICLKSNLFFYCNDQHAKMSSVTVSLMKRFGIAFHVQEGDLRTCNIGYHGKHDGLMPFFSANKSLLREYDKILVDPKESTERKEEVNGYKGQLLGILNKGEHFDTCFHCTGAATTTGWALPEDDWTKRLFHSLPKYLPKDSKLRLTYAEEKNFSDLQSYYSKVACARMYLFHGAPDMVLTVKKTNVSIMDSDTDDDNMDSIVHVVTIYPLDSGSNTSEDDGVIEMARATVPMTEVVPLPEKIGQLVAELHFIALAKIARNLVNCNCIMKTVKVKGILVDKSNGIVDCKLVAKASTATAPVLIEVTCVDRNGLLCSSALCRSCQDISSN